MIPHNGHHKGSGRCNHNPQDGRKVIPMDNIINHWLSHQISNLVPLPMQAGALAEDTVYEAFVSASLRVIKSRAGSIADVRDAVDLLAVIGHDVHMIQVKLGDGNGSRTVPHPPHDIIKSLAEKGMDIILHVFHVYGDVINGNIDANDLIEALNHEEAVLFV